MPTAPTDSIVPVLQVAVGPVILISGVGLLLLSMTNRFGRIIDRARHLRKEDETANEAGRRKIASELDVLWRRARVVRRAITLATICVLSAALLVISLFVAAVAGADAHLVVIAIFAGGMAALVASLLLFLYDIKLSLDALRFELGEAVHE